MTEDEAKVAFLQYIHTWPTFGSTFFDVKQTTESTYPEVITVVINKRGISIIHPQTKVHNYCIYSCLLMNHIEYKYFFLFLVTYHNMNSVSCIEKCRVARLSQAVGYLTMV